MQSLLYKFERWLRVIPIIRWRIKWIICNMRCSSKTLYFDSINLEFNIILNFSHQSLCKIWPLLMSFSFMMMYTLLIWNHKKIVFQCCFSNFVLLKQLNQVSVTLSLIHFVFYLVTKKWSSLWWIITWSIYPFRIHLLVNNAISTTRFPFFRFLVIIIHSLSWI